MNQQPFEISFTLSWWWLFYVWLTTSYSAGVWGIRTIAKKDSTAPLSILGLFYVLSPLWVPFWLLGKIITVGTRKDQ